MVYELGDDDARSGGARTDDADHGLERAAGMMVDDGFARRPIEDCFGVLETMGCREVHADEEVGRALEGFGRDEALRAGQEAVDRGDLLIVCGQAGDLLARPSGFDGMRKRKDAAKRIAIGIGMGAERDLLRHLDELDYLGKAPELLLALCEREGHHASSSSAPSTMG